MSTWHAMTRRTTTLRDHRRRPHRLLVPLPVRRRSHPTAPRDHRRACCRRHGDDPSHGGAKHRVRHTIGRRDDLRRRLCRQRRTRPGDADAAAFANPGRLAAVAAFYGLCPSQWPATPGDFNTPVESAIPALVLAGSYDPATPPEGSRQVADTLTNSTFLLVEPAGHGVTFLSTHASPSSSSPSSTTRPPRPTRRAPPHSTHRTFDDHHPRGPADPLDRQ